MTYAIAHWPILICHYKIAEWLIIWRRIPLFCEAENAQSYFSSLCCLSAAGDQCPSKVTGAEPLSWRREELRYRFECFSIFAPRNRRDTFSSVKSNPQSRRSCGKGIPWHLDFPNMERKCAGHGTALNGAVLTYAAGVARQHP